MLKILIVEGNSAENCEESRRHGMPTQSELYVDTIESIAPEAQCDVVHPADRNSSLPAGVDVAQYDGVAWTGSASNIYNATPDIVRQIELARHCFANGSEIFGSCWGLQVATVAAGGVVSANTKGREIGIARKIELTADGADHALYDGKQNVFDAVAIHLDHVTTMPADSTVLARNDYSDVQAMEIRRGKATFWGVQYHPEFDLAYVGALIRRYRDLLIDEGLCHNESTVDDLAARYAELSATPERTDLRWLLGVDDDVLDDRCRLLEIENWLKRVASR